jgi:signal transduction histidine kinase
MEHVLGIVAHELRTPLAGMRAISEYLLTDGTGQSPQASNFLRQLNGETVRMAETVNDLLEAARLNSGRANWNWSHVDLRSICQEAIDTVLPLVDPASVRLSLDVHPPGACMLGDADAVRRLVINLLSNARKYTLRGTIDVVVTLERDCDHDWISIQVRDTGEGISPRILARLGEAFALNAGVVGAQHVGGTGLGLAICKGIAAAHGGFLKVESTCGSGTSITARLRADLSEPSTARPRVELATDVLTSTHGVAL